MKTLLDVFYEDDYFSLLLLTSYVSGQEQGTEDFENSDVTCSSDSYGDWLKAVLRIVMRTINIQQIS